MRKWSCDLNHNRVNPDTEIDIVSEPDCQHFSQFGSLVLTVWIITNQITIPMSPTLGPQNLAVVLITMISPGSSKMDKY